MIIAATVGHSLARAGLILDALFAAEALCSLGRSRRVAIAGALVLTPALLAGALWRSTQVSHLRHHPLLALAGVLAAVAVIVALAWLLRARPGLLAPLALLALPFRFSVLSGGTGGVLLALYVVIAAGSLALLASPATPRERSVSWVARALAAFIVVYALQALYTPDLSRAVQAVGFFDVPFALLFVLLTGLRWDRELIGRCLRVVLALALLFVAVAAVEYGAKRLIFHAALNNDERFFRVNSLFYDPNIYGRFLAVAMVLLAAAMMWEQRRRALLVATAVLAVCWLGLVGSVSQSSIIALLAGLAVIAAARFSPRASAAAVVLVLAAGAAIAAADAGKLHLSFSDTSSANVATSGRAGLVTEGVTLFGDRPLAGFGSGSFSCEYRRHTGAEPALSCATPSAAGVTSDSHTTPITIAAEQGVVGLLAYVALLAAAARTLAGGALRASPARVAILAAAVALVVHTWAYADFLEDPTMWALLAVGAVLARD